MNPGPLLLVALVGTLSGALCWRTAPRVWLAGTLTGLVAALAAAALVLTGGDVWDWSTRFEIGGEAVHLQLDALGAFFMVLLCVVGGAATVYAGEYWTDAAHPRSAGLGRLWWSLLLMSLGLVLVAVNGLHFLIAWELFTLAAYFLVTLDRTRAEVRAAGWLYLGASHVAMLALFAFFTI